MNKTREIVKRHMARYVKDLPECETARWERSFRRIDFGDFAYPTVQLRWRRHDIGGITADFPRVYLMRGPVLLWDKAADPAASYIENSIPYPRFWLLAAARITSTSIVFLPCCEPMTKASDMMLSISLGLPCVWPTTAFMAASSVMALELPPQASLWVM